MLHYFKFIKWPTTHPLLLSIAQPPGPCSLWVSESSLTDVRAARITKCFLVLVDSNSIRASLSLAAFAILLARPLRRCFSSSCVFFASPSRQTAFSFSLRRRTKVRSGLVNEEGWVALCAVRLSIHWFGFGSFFYRQWVLLADWAERQTQISSSVLPDVLEKTIFRKRFIDFCRTIGDNGGNSKKHSFQRLPNPRLIGWAGVAALASRMYMYLSGQHGARKFTKNFNCAFATIVGPKIVQMPSPLIVKDRMLFHCFALTCK